MNIRLIRNNQVTEVLNSMRWHFKTYGKRPYNTYQKTSGLLVMRKNSLGEYFAINRRPAYCKREAYNWVIKYLRKLADSFECDAHHYPIDPYSKLIFRSNKQFSKMLFLEAVKLNLTHAALIVYRFDWGNGIKEELPFSVLLKEYNPKLYEEVMNGYEEI